ncbi:MAG: IS110 family transposase [Elusimicrobia bacterium]|nr:IS110 family transposase [Elusimicrobiota bacterium]
MKKLFVGIDVAEAKFDVAFRDVKGQPVRPDVIFPNSPDGIRDLKGAITAAASLVGKRTSIVAGMESTSNFHKNLAAVLYSARPRKIEVHVINPFAVKQFKKMHLKVYKTDKLDAHMIALYLAQIAPKPALQDLPGQEGLKELTRIRRSFQEETTKFKNRLRRLLRVHFHGYKLLLGTKISMKMLVAFSLVASPDEIISMGKTKLSKLSVAFRHKVGPKFAANLIKLAETAPVKTLPDGTSLVIKWTAQRLIQLLAQIKTLDENIVSSLDSFFPDHCLNSIPGLGPVSVATIIAEVGDIKRFETPGKFIGYVGLYPVVWESGEIKARFKMTIKGNKSLKMTFLVASAAARLFNPVIRDFYDHLRARGKSKKAAGGAVARKLALLAYAILHDNEPWNSEKALAGLKKSVSMRADSENTGDRRSIEVIPHNVVNATIPVRDNTEPPCPPNIIVAPSLPAGKRGGFIKNP